MACPPTCPLEIVKLFPQFSRPVGNVQLTAPNRAVVAVLKHANSIEAGGEKDSQKKRRSVLFGDCGNRQLNLNPRYCTILLSFL